MSYPPQPPPGPQDPWQQPGRPPAPPPGFGIPQPPLQGPAPRRRNNTPLLIGIGVAAFVLLAGCCCVAAMLGADDQPDSTAATSTPAAPTSPATTAAPSPTGPVVKTVTMPRVTGKNAAVTDDELRKLGFTQIQYGSQDENDTVVLLLSNWTVTKQSTKAGVKVKTDTLIVLTCTKED